MRLLESESDHDSTLSVSPDVAASDHALALGIGLGIAPSHPAASSSVSSSPSSPFGTDVPGPSKASHANGNGFVPPVTNGSVSSTLGVGGTVLGNGVVKHGKAVARVSPPGTTLYDDSFVDREEFMRLVIQSLRDVGYVESAATLEAESGYTMEAPEVSEFRQFILDANWNAAEAALVRLGVTEDEGLWQAKFLIGQQKFLELLEVQKTILALNVLRNELAPLNASPDQMCSLTNLIMCSDPDDLRQRAGWDGASGSSRLKLLANLQRYIPSSIMIPQRRFSSLLNQARLYQRQHCVYHNSPTNSSSFSLYTDHQCDKTAFPRVTTTILAVHTDEVWNMEWSHDGMYLASASKDKSAIIWRIGPETEPSLREYTPELILRDHQYAVGCLAWSPDDSVLLTSSESFIKLWNTKSGVCIRELESHSDTVTALEYLPDGSGFISGGLDRKMIIWDADGTQRDTWGNMTIRVTDLAVTPDFTRVVAVGLHPVPPSPSATTTDLTQPLRVQAGTVETSAPAGNTTGAVGPGSRTTEGYMLVYDLATKQVEFAVHLEGDSTNVKVSHDSQYALINHAPHAIHLWDLNQGQLVRKFTGQQQERHVIRSCFGGVDGNFIVSGSEDGNVYVWHRDSGTLLEVLPGHGSGSVNSVAWNPTNENMFASCSDDSTIRIWEAPPTSPTDIGTGHIPTQNGKGKGKTRQRWDGDGVGPSSTTMMAQATTATATGSALRL